MDVFFLSIRLMDVFFLSIRLMDVFFLSVRLMDVFFLSETALSGRYIGRRRGLVNTFRGDHKSPNTSDIFKQFVTFVIAKSC